MATTGTLVRVGTKLAVPGERNQALQALQEAVKTNVLHSLAKNTLRTYRTQWGNFETWCRVQGHRSKPAAPEVVAGYVSVLAEGNGLDPGKKPGSINTALSAIGWVHRNENLADPTASALVKRTMSGIRRRKGVRTKQQKPIDLPVMVKLVEATPAKNIRSVRDRAILLFGFASALRRETIVALDVEDLKTTPQGFFVTIRREKTDQEGAGRDFAIPYNLEHPDFCPVKAVQAWLQISKVSTGPLFRGLKKGGVPSSTRMAPTGIYGVVKRAFRAAGIDARGYSPHSMRAGHVTEARRQGIDDSSIMAVTGHRKRETVERYNREQDAFKKTSAGSIWQGLGELAGAKTTKEQA